MSLPFSLKRVLTIFFILVAAVPVLAFGVLNIQLITTHQLAGVSERNMSQAKSIVEEVESFLVEVYSDLNHVEQTIASGIIQHPDDIDRFLANMVRNSQFFESIYLLDQSRKVVKFGVLPKLQPRRDDYAKLDFSGHQLFQHIDAINGPVWSNTFVSLVTGEPSVTLGLPALNGFILGNIRLSSLGKLLHKYSSQVGVEVSIVDETGTLVAHSDLDMAKQRVNFGDHPAIVQALRGSETTGEFDQGEKRYLESAARIHSTDWVVWVGLDMNAVLAPIQNMRSLLIGFMVASALLAGIVALLTARRLMMPLSALGKKAGQVADGLYEFRFAPSGFTEIDLLASQFASMTEAIKVRELSIITNEKRFRNLVNSIDGIVWEMDYPSFKFLFVSKQAESILGFPVEDWYTQPSFWEDRIHCEDREQAKSYCRMMAEQLADHDFEYRMIAADGSVVWIRDLVTVVVENNRPARLLGVMIDITAQKQLLDELSRSEQNYREIFNAASDAIFIHDAETGEVVDVNQSMLKLFNCTYSEALDGGMEAFSLGSLPYDSDEYRRKLEEAKSKGSCTFEWRSCTATGEPFWSEIYLRSAMIGNLPRILAAVWDISERKEAAEKIREAHERMHLLIERMPLGCILWAPDLSVEIWNPAAESIFGYPAQDMIGKYPFDLIIPDNMLERTVPVWSRLMIEGKSSYRMNNLTMDGSLITCEWFNTPIRSASGEVIGIISMVQDISDRKAVEDELTRYRGHLEDLVKERTAQLEAAQAEIVQKGRLAVLGQLTATVSHEIRNPLGTVANALYILKDALSGQKQEHILRPLLLAERNVERCDNIISELLDFSRQRMIKKTPIDIDAWLAEFLDEHSLPDQVTCERSLASATTVPVDAERLRRVMVNAVTNALQALDEVAKPEKVLTVSTRVVGDRCEIEIKDNGSGMSKEVLGRISEPMFSTKNFGVGLGVPIIVNIIESHGGGVFYKSEPGEGTIVTMWLPLAD